MGWTLGLPVRGRGKNIFLILASFVSLIFSQSCLAHVKWFTDFDISARPQSVELVLNAQFFQFVLATLLICILIVILDYFWPKVVGYIKPLQFFENRVLASFSSEQALEDIIRIATSAFFVAIWAIGGFIITPELETDSEIVGFVQLGIALCACSRKTMYLSGIGMIALYIYATSQYGLFHLADYPIFIGIALFLIIRSHPKLAGLHAYSFSVLYFCISVTLLWASIEKWAYPQWSFSLLESKPGMTMGMSASTFMALAGFVEFVLAFLLVASRNLLPYIAIGLNAIFAAAIIEFGKIDAVGHFLIIICLTVMALKGFTKINNFLYVENGNTLRLSMASGVIYLVTLVVIFSSYYLLQFSLYG